MKHRRMLLTTLLSIVLVLTLIVPACAAGTPSIAIPLRDNYLAAYDSGPASITPQIGPAGIVGQTREVNCDILTSVHMVAYLDGVEKDSTFSDGDGNYMFELLEPGQYEVVASKWGFREERQSIAVELEHQHTLDFTGDHGLVPNSPEMSYVLACINLWQFGEPHCKLTMSTVLAVVNAWQFPADDLVYLTLSSTDGGQVTDPGEGTFGYDAGTVVDLVATPDEGYRFDEWTGDVVTIADVNATTTTITMNDDYSITARFEEASAPEDNAEYLPGEPAPLTTTAESESGASAYGSPLIVTLDDGTSASLPGLPGTYEVTLERLDSDLPVTATLQDMTQLVPTGSMRRLSVTGEGDASDFKPVITIPASEAGSINLETVNVLRVGDVLVNGELVHDHGMMLPLSLDDDGNLYFVDPLLPDGLVPADESAQAAALSVQAGVAREEERQWMGSAYYLLMTFQDDMNWSRGPQLVRMIPDFALADAGYRRPATAEERTELAKKPVTNIIVLVHGHNEEEKEGTFAFSESEPWLFNYKRLVWDLFYREIMAEEDQQPVYPYEGTAFYEFIYPTYRPIFSPVPDRTGEFGWRHETLGEALGRLVSEELEHDPQLAAMIEEDMAFNVIIVTHSQGGVVARAGFHHMPEEFKERIVRFVSWGSPHHGAALYTLRYALQAGHDILIDGVRLPFQSIRNNRVTGPILVGLVNWLVVLDTPGVRDLRWDASKKHLLDIRAILPSIKDDATEEGITPSLYSENLAIFNETFTSEKWYMKGTPYTLIYGATSKTAELELVDVEGGWLFRWRKQQLLRFFVDSTDVEQGAALNKLVMKSAYSPNDGALPVYSQKAEGVELFTVVNMEDVDHEEFYGAEPEQRTDATIFLGVLTAERTFDEVGLLHPTRAIPVLEAEIEAEIEAVIEAETKQTVVTGRLLYPIYEIEHGGDGKLGERIERVEARAGSQDGSVIQELVFAHEDDGSFEGRGDSSAVPEGPIAVVAVFVDKSEVETVLEEEEVTFPDPNLEAAIREAIGKPTGPIWQSDLKGLSTLDARLRSIADLTGLEYCTDLTDVVLYGNHVTDISPLQGLTKLTRLELAHNQISDISALAGLTSLFYLDLGSNQIGDISPLAGLTNLILLGLGDNQISDISPLAGLTNLILLGLGDNQISDISPLAGLTNLAVLSLQDNQISDVSPLAGLTELEHLSLGDNQISDISPLAALTNLTYLWLPGNQIGDISPLAGLTNLTSLGLGDNQISNIAALASLTNLTLLELGDNQIVDIKPLVDNPGLGDGTYIGLMRNPLSMQSRDEYIPELRERGVSVLY